jgi:hypothetical protein
MSTFTATVPVLLSAALSAAAPAYELVPTTEFIRSEKSAEGLSGIAFAGGRDWWCVEDRTATLCRFTVKFDDEGSVESFVLAGSVKLEGCVDVEACAVDPLRKGVIYVADEKNSSVSAHDVKSGRRLETVRMPGDFKRQIRINRSLESLAISPDGLTMWTANEDTLVSDGECAGAGRGGNVRIMRFVRSGAGAEWKFSGWCFYATDPAEGEQYKGSIFSGLVELADPGDGTLLALEREMSRKNPLFPSFRSRIYSFKPLTGGEKIPKSLIWGEDTFISNYEGMGLGPAGAGGARRLMMVADGGGEAVEAVRSFLLKPVPPDGK